MQIELKNEKGSFCIGGGSHPVARLDAIEGIGVVAKVPETVIFEGQPGRTTIDIRDAERTITLSFDFYSDEYEVKRLYNIISHPVQLCFFLRNSRRKITGRLMNATDASGIIYHCWYRIVLQFVCDDPYFHDLYDTESGISAIINNLPNANENGESYIQLPAVATERINSGVVINKGDTKVYPVIELYNHKTEEDSPEVYGLTIANQTTGAVIELEYSMAPAEKITIDLIKRKITSSLAGNITNCISDNTFLASFFLTEGENKVSFETLNSNDNIVVKMYHNNNYIGVVI